MGVSLGVRIVGTGRAVPRIRVSARLLEMDHGLPPGALSASGVFNRYFCEDESQIDLAVEACTLAIAESGVHLGDVDTVIFGAAVPFQLIPSTAPLVMRALGIPDGQAAAFDVNSTCLSFLTALDTAARMIVTGQSEVALVVSAEIASRALPWQSAPETAALFGDGAGAVVLTKAPPDSSACVVASGFRTFPSAYEASALGAGGTRIDYHRDKESFEAFSRFSMDGRALFKVTTANFTAFVEELLGRAGWTKEECNLVVPHQASPVALNHMIKQTGFSPKQVVNIAADYGNQIAASIPFALDVARRTVLLSEGSKVLLLGTSAGVSFGGMALVI